MSSNNDNKVFTKFSVGVGLQFINRIYNPLYKYFKTIKKCDLNVVYEYRDFLFNFKHIVQERDIYVLSNFKYNSTFFNSIIVSSIELVRTYNGVYDTRTYDVIILLLDKLLEKYYKKFK